MNDFIFSGSRDICISAHVVPLSALLDARSLKERLTGDPGSVWIICRHFVIQVNRLTSRYNRTLDRISKTGGIICGKVSCLDTSYA